MMMEREVNKKSRMNALFFFFFFRVPKRIRRPRRPKTRAPASEWGWSTDASSFRVINTDTREREREREREFDDLGLQKVSPFFPIKKDFELGEKNSWDQTEAGVGAPAAAAISEGKTR